MKRMNVVKNLNLLIVLSICISGMAQQKGETIQTDTKSELLNESTPEIFLPGIVSKPGIIEMAPAFTPDQQTLYFTRFNLETRKTSIWICHLKNGQWTEPELAPFSGQHNDAEPFITCDGKRLYFSSHRPMDDDLDRKDWNIWYMDKTPDGWGEPQPLDTTINTKAKERHATISKDGTMYFHVNSGESYDLYRSEPIDGKYQSREKLSSVINTEEFIEGEPTVSPDERYIIFVTYGREDRVAKRDKTCDLYISFADEQGNWGEAKCLGPKILSGEEENWPYISPDGKSLYFTSARDTSDFPDIYKVDAKLLEELKP